MHRPLGGRSLGGRSLGGRSLSARRGSGVDPSLKLDLQFAAKKVLDANFGPSVTFTRASNGKLFNSSGVQQYAPNNELENANLTVVASGVPSGWAAMNAESDSNTFEAVGSYQKITFTAANDRPAIKNVVAYTKATTHTAGFYVHSIDFTSGNKIILKANNTGSGGTDGVIDVDDLSGEGWHAVGFTAGTTDTTVDFEWGLGRTAAATGTLVASRPFVVKGLLPGVGVNSPAKLSGEPLGEWIGTDDGDEPLYTARFDHDPANSNASLGLLVEEARTNICLQSKNWPTTWTKTNTDHPTTNNASPDGNSDAIELAATSTADQQFAQYQGFTGLTAGVNTTVSASMRPGTNATFVQLAWDSDGSGDDGVFCNFNLSTGAKGTVTAMTAGTATLATIQDIGNSNYRIAVTGKIAVGTVGRFTINIVDRIDAAKFEAADLTDNDSLIGTDAGVVVGSHVTSVIPTTTAAVTKAANVPSTTFDPGAAFTWNVNGRTAPGSGTQVLGQIDDSGGTPQDNSVRLERNASNKIHLIVNDGGVEQADIDIGTVADSTDFKIAVRVKANDFHAALDGTLATPDTSGTVPTGLTDKHIGKSDSGDQHNGTLARDTIWTAGKPNGFLVALTE